MGLSDGFDVDQLQGQHHIDVFLVECEVFLVRTDVVDVGIVKVCLVFGQGDHFIGFVLIQKFAVLIQHLERIPLAWIVTGREDESATGV